MSSTWEELRFYVQLAATLFQPKYDLSKVPGPRGHFALGNITGVMRPDYHVQMLEWANQYGGVFKFSLGFQWVVVVSDPKIAVQVLGRGPDSIPRKCVGYKFFDLATNANGAHSFFTTSDEAQWAAVRKAAAAAFSSANVRKAFPIALRHSRLVAASLEPGAASDPHNPYSQLWHDHHNHHNHHQAAARQERRQHCPQHNPSLWTQQQTTQKAGRPKPTGHHLAAAAAAAAGPLVTGASGGFTAEQHSGTGTLKAEDVDSGPGGVVPVAAAPPDVPCTCGNQCGRSHMGGVGKAAREGEGEGGRGTVLYGGDEIGLGGCLSALAPEPASPLCSPPSSSFTCSASSAAVVVDIQEHLELSLLHVFVEALFGIRPEDFPGRQVAADMNLVLEEANERLKVPLRKVAMAVWHPWAQARVRAAQLRLAKVYGNMYDTIRSRGTPPDSVTDLWACLSRVRHPSTGELLGRQELVPEIGALMMAGFDTSSHSVAWVLFSLAAHPEVQQRCHRELTARGLVRHRGCPDGPRDPSLDDLSQLPYLNAVIDETMRMYPVAATASVREVTRPTRVGDFVIPPGVIVWPMLYALHNSVHNWDSPHEFRPERWMAGNAAAAAVDGDGNSAHAADGADGSAAAAVTAAATAAAAARSAPAAGPDQAEPVLTRGGRADGAGGSGSISPSSPSSSPRAASGRRVADGDAGGDGGDAGDAAGGGGGKRFMPFSDGMKSCLGQAMGLMEVRTMLVVLLGRYRFQLDPSMGGPEAVRRNMVMSLTLKIKGGLRLVASPLGPQDDFSDGS